MEVACCVDISGLLSNIARQALSLLPSPLVGLWGSRMPTGLLSCPELEAVGRTSSSPHGPQPIIRGMRPVRRVLSRAPAFLFYAI